MGWGDEIMALGQAQRHFRETGRSTVIVDAKGRPRWSEIWDGEPALARRPGPGIDALVNGAQCRPYLLSLNRRDGATFSDWRARDHRAVLRPTPHEVSIAARLTAGLGPFVVLEPEIDPKGNPNKQWGKGRWAELAALLRAQRPDVALVQLSLPGAPSAGTLRRLPTASFRQACAVLARAGAAVLPEGGLHHAAAALGVPAAVIFGGHTDPETTGYPEHVNLFVGPRACGQWQPCGHCAKAMAAIAPAEVAAALGRLLDGDTRPAAAGAT